MCLKGAVYCAARRSKQKEHAVGYCNFINMNTVEKGINHAFVDGVKTKALKGAEKDEYPAIWDFNTIFCQSILQIQHAKSFYR